MDKKEVNDYIHDMSCETKTDKWLIFFYSVPSRPVSKRMKIWRRLIKAGALHFSGSVYMLPFNDDNLEFFQWLTSEINLMSGEGSFVRVKNIETRKNSEIRMLFNKQRDKEYKLIEKEIDEIERRIQNIKKGTKNQDKRRLFVQLNKLNREFEDINKIDFFDAESGRAIGKKMKTIKTEISTIAGFETKKEKPAGIVPKSINEFKGKIWVTRKKPFVDRMASAWLIRKFIDKDAAFDFKDEDDLEGLDSRFITFDLQGGVFTHIGSMCTFEVLLNTFNLKSKALKKIAEIVHELDIKDGKYTVSEANGIEDILLGVKKTAKNDIEGLEKGMAVFDMLYASKS